jgi:hypothetical protein
MKSLSTKLVLSTLGIALLATPALAQQSHRPIVDSVQNGGSGFSTYPNPVTHSGSEMSREQGNNTMGGTD